jgi:hypothetical protein
MTTPTPDTLTTRLTSAPALTTHPRWGASHALLLAWGHGRDGSELDFVPALVAQGYPAAAAHLLRLA